VIQTGGWWLVAGVDLRERKVLLSGRCQVANVNLLEDKSTSDWWVKSQANETTHELHG
jgi:hypothetical protein